MGLPNIFITDEDLRSEHEIQVEGDNARHLIRSLRVRPGEDLEAVLPGKIKFRCKVSHVDPSRLSLKILNSSVIEPQKTQVTLFQAISRTAILDVIVRQATELGVSRIVLFPSKNSPVESLASAKLERLSKIALEAAKQSRRSEIPEVLVLESQELIGENLKAENFISSRNSDYDPSIVKETNFYFVLLDENEDDRPFMWNPDPDLSQQYIIVICGPEGGFQEDEKQTFLTAGAARLKLGSTILRAETAAITGLAVVMDIFRDQGLSGISP